MKIEFAGVAKQADANYLINNGFVFTRYLATDYIEYPTKETVFLKETALKREEIDINELFNGGENK